MTRYQSSKHIVIHRKHTSLPEWYMYFDTGNA